MMSAFEPPDIINVRYLIPHRFVFTEKTAKPKYVKTGTGKGRGRPPKRKIEENDEEQGNLLKGIDN